MSRSPYAEDDLSFEEMTLEQLEMEVADLRSDVEAITLDLLDDAKGGFYRGERWRVRARAARAYKQSDLNAATALLKFRRSVLDTPSAAHAAAITKDWNTLDPKAKLHAIVAMEQVRCRLERAREKTQRLQIESERQARKERRIISALRAIVGEQAYRALLARAGVEEDDPAEDTLT